ncbi:MAG: hypothetical protein ACLRSW_13415 [Christensenellaceae bacterium]
MTKIISTTIPVKRRTPAFTMHMTLSSHGAYNDLVDTGIILQRFFRRAVYDSDMTEEECLKNRPLKRNFPKKAVKTLKILRLIDGYPQTFAAKGIDTPGRLIRPAGKVYLGTRFQGPRIWTKRHRCFPTRCTGRLDDTAFLFYADHPLITTSRTIISRVPLGEGWNTALYNIPFCGRR